MEIVAYVEKTMEDQMPQIELVMAMTLAKRQGTRTVDMKIDREDCGACPVCPNPHYHLVGTPR